MTTPKRPRCSKCGASNVGMGRTHTADGPTPWTCHDLFACGERVGAKGERERIKAGIEEVREAMRRDLVGACREGAQKALDRVIAVVGR
jgi:hypothetical protein